MNTPVPSAVVITMPDANALDMAFTRQLFTLKQRLSDHQRSGARAGEYSVANKLTTLRHHAEKAGHSGICIAASRLIGQVYRCPTPGTPDTAA